jgi:hypothetical protein
MGKKLTEEQLANRKRLLALSRAGRERDAAWFAAQPASFKLALEWRFEDRKYMLDNGYTPGEAWEYCEAMWALTLERAQIALNEEEGNEE